MPFMTITARTPPRVALIALAALSACAAPRLGPVRAITSHAGALLVGAPGTIAPAAEKIAESPGAARVRATFEGALPAAAKGSLRHEPALDLVARVAADMVSAERQPPSVALTEWLFWRAGAVSRPSRLEIMIAEGVDDLDLQLADLAGRAQASVYPESFGVARSSRRRGAQVVVFGRRLLDLGPLKKSHAPGAAITLKAKPLDAFGDLTLLADDADGGVIEERMARAEGGVFTTTHKAPDKPGRYFLEIIGHDARTQASTPENPWRRTLFLAPIYVGVPEPAQPDAFIGAPAGVDPASFAAQIQGGYNAARARAGKKPIATDGRLSTLAQERANNVARAGREPPPDVVLADKIAAAGSPPHDYDATEVRVDAGSDHVGLRLLAPSSRRRILAPDALLVGLGVAPRAASAAGLRETTLVEYLVEPVARLDPIKDRQKVLDALDAQAKAEGRAAYEHDEDVAKVVQQFASEVCRGQARQNQMKLLVDKARGVGEKFKRWSTPVWRAGYDFARWQEASVLAKAKEAPLSHAEVGLCQGDMPGKPGGSYVVVIQYGL